MTGRDIIGGSANRIKQGATQGGKIGAATGAGISAAVATYSAVQDVRKGSKSLTDATRTVAFEVVKGTADGAAKGVASGAATAGARVLAERTASQGLKRVLGSSAPAALAITAVEVAKHAVDFARGVKTAEEFRLAAKSSAKGGAVSFVGAEIGFAIGGPVGAIIGGIAGPAIADQAEKAGLGVRLDRLFSFNTATGHDGATTFHLEQLRGLLAELQSSSAVVFPDRILQTDTGHHASAEIVMVHQGKIYAVDFKAWKGKLSFPEIVEKRIIVEKGWIWDSTNEIEIGTGKTDTTHVSQVKTDQYGIVHTKVHRHPIRNLSSFAYHMKNRLIAENSRWKHVRIETLVVFPDDQVEFSEDILLNANFTTYSNFLKLLTDEGGSVTPRWMLDGVSLIPTWDLLYDTNGTIYQGIIQTPCFTMQMTDGEVKIPFDAVLKVDVVQGGTLSRSDKIMVTLRDRNTLEGTVEKQEISLMRKGHSHTYLLHDLSMVCPAYSLLLN